MLTTHTSTLSSAFTPKENTPPPTQHSISILLEKARSHPLTDAEVQQLADALTAQPWLEWAHKREEGSTFSVDPVPLFIHERISTQALLATAKRTDIPRDLFADPQQKYRDAVQFYAHEVPWANRLILGDSLHVMDSLAHREGLTGQVQMIYIDPPYGINYRSNFQPDVFKTSVRDIDTDLTREVAQIQAYRDTWQLGIHSYLSYLRKRFVLARELLTDSGSVFVQIGDDNVHLVRCLMDEVFGNENFVAMIYFQTAANQNTKRIQRLYDVILWYQKTPALKYHPMFKDRTETQIESVFAAKDPVSGERYKPMQMSVPKQSAAYERLFQAERLTSNGSYWKRNASDFPYIQYDNVWTGTIESTFSKEKVYVVQTNRNVIQRCMLMTTDPGDLVLDPTCGSGTTAYVAEQWGRRWITIDTSRIAITLARNRLLTATYDAYKLKDPSAGITSGFVLKTVPHIQLRDIANNVALDPIFAKHDPILKEKLETLNAALSHVTQTLRQSLHRKLSATPKREQTDAVKRRWQLPETAWEAWEVPYDTDPDWPHPLQVALTDYRAAWREKMDEVNACIAASAKQEVLVDQPEIVKNRVRVSGPFTVESVQPPAQSLYAGGEPVVTDRDPANAAASLEKMIALLKTTGVDFEGNPKRQFQRLDRFAGADGILHAEGQFTDDERAVAVVFGPPHGTVTALQVEDSLQAARRDYDVLLCVGFHFEAEARAILQETHRRIETHLVQIAPDVAMADLLKTAHTDSLFTVIGAPRISVASVADGEFSVTMEGIDTYNPVDNTIEPTRADRVAAWFLDSDYDGRTFCPTQAFFPDRSAWRKIVKALRSVIDEDRLSAFSGTVSLPFRAGVHRRIAVKVIDRRGNELMHIQRLTQDLE